MSYEEEDTCVSYEEEDTCVSYEEEDTCVSYEAGSVHWARYSTEPEKRSILEVKKTYHRIKRDLPSDSV